MIKLLRIPKIDNKRYKPEFGDILYGDEFIAGKVKFVDIQRPIWLSNFGSNHWNVLKKFDIDCEYLQKKVTYTCYITENIYYWFIPIMILCEKTKPGYYRNISEDFKGAWHDFHFDEKNTLNFIQNFDSCLEEPNQIQQSLIGHGYTECTLPSDGSNSLETVWINMSNGDKLVGFCWIWHNK